MAGKKIALFGIFPGYQEVERAADVLMESGFAGDDISVLLRDDGSTRAFANEKNTKAPEGSDADLIGILRAMGIPDFRVKRFEARLKEGGLLLSVRCSSPVSATRAENLLKQTGAQEITTAADVTTSVDGGGDEGPVIGDRRELSAP